MASREEQVLSLWTNGVDTVVAFDEEDAKRVCSEHMGEEFEQYCEDYGDDEWEMVSPNKELTIWEECYTGTPKTKLASAWLVESERGFLCSTEC